MFDLNVESCYILNLPTLLQCNEDRGHDIYWYGGPDGQRQQPACNPLPNRTDIVHTLVNSCSHTAHSILQCALPTGSCAFIATPPGLQNAYSKHKIATQNLRAVRALALTPCWAVSTDCSRSSTPSLLSAMACPLAARLPKEAVMSSSSASWWRMSASA